MSEGAGEHERLRKRIRILRVCRRVILLLTIAWPFLAMLLRPDRLLVTYPIKKGDTGQMLLVVASLLLPWALLAAGMLIVMLKENALWKRFAQVTAAQADLPALLRSHMDVEIEDLGDCLTIQQLISAGLIHEGERMTITGRNRFSGFYAGRFPLCSSWLRIDWRVTSSPITLYTGQVALLETPVSFTGKLLLYRPSVHARLINSVFGGGDFGRKSQAVTGVRLPLGWAVESDVPDAARAALADNPAFLDKLRDAEQLDFMLVHDRHLVLGGHFDFTPQDLNDAAPADTCRRAVRDLFERGIDVALAFIPSDGSAGSVSISKRDS